MIRRLGLSRKQYILDIVHIWLTHIVHTTRRAVTLHNFQRTGIITNYLKVIKDGGSWIGKIFTNNAVCFLSTNTQKTTLIPTEKHTRIYIDKLATVLAILNSSLKPLGIQTPEGLERHLTVTMSLECTDPITHFSQRCHHKIHKLVSLQIFINETQTFLNKNNLSGQLLTPSLKVTKADLCKGLP